MGSPLGKMSEAAVPLLIRTGLGLNLPQMLKTKGVEGTCGEWQQQLIQQMRDKQILGSGALPLDVKTARREWSAALAATGLSAGYASVGGVLLAKHLQNRRLSAESGGAGIASRRGSMEMASTGLPRLERSEAQDVFQKMPTVVHREEVPTDHSWENAPLKGSMSQSQVHRMQGGRRRR